MAHISNPPTAAGTAPTSDAPDSRDKAHDAGLAQCLRLLGDDNRLRIFTLLTKAEMCVCEIEEILGLSQSLVSNHLAALRRAGLVESRRDEEDARWIFYRASREAAAALRHRLDALLDVQPSPGNRRRAEEFCEDAGREMRVAESVD